MRYKIRVKRINQVFRHGSDYDSRLARLAVLYEDLRLENLAASAKSIDALDSSGVDVRGFYFIRRSIATVREFAEALRLLDECPEFAPIRAKFDSERRTMWGKSMRFFARREAYFGRIRNDFGGHFGEPAARFAINHLHDGAVAFEYAADSIKRTGNVRFKFASEVVAIGMKRHALADESHDHFRLMFRLALAGFGHAARCAQTLAVYDLWPRFNGILP